MTSPHTQRQIATLLPLVLQALNENAGRCLDNDSDRAAVGQAVTAAIVGAVPPTCALCHLDLADLGLITRLVAEEHRTRKQDSIKEGLKTMYKDLLRQTADILVKLDAAAKLAAAYARAEAGLPR